MMNKTLSLLLAVAMVLAAVFPAAAASEGVPLLSVEVRDLLMNPVAATETDALGYFSLPGLDAADYLLVISDPASDLEYRQNLAVPADLAPALLHGRVMSDPEADVSFDVAASLYDETGLPPAETYAIRMRFKWNGNSMRSSGKFWVFVRGDDVTMIENVVLSSDQGSLEAAAMRTNGEGTKLMAEFSKAEAYRALVPADAVRGDTVEVAISVVTPGGVQEEMVSVRILGKK